MFTELDELIEYYETEKNNLQSLIKNCVDEMDYNHAYYHFRALRKVNHKLQTLHNLKDPSYDSRERLESRKASYEDMLNKEKHESFKNFYSDEISAIEKELNELNNKKSKTLPDSQELDDCIYEVAEGRLPAFKFYLLKTEDFFLELRRVQNSIIISFTPNKFLGEYSIIKSNLKALIGMGFYLNIETDRLEYVYDLTSFSNSIFIKTLLGRIVFDVFYYKHFDDPTFIEKLIE